MGGKPKFGDPMFKDFAQEDFALRLASRGCRWYYGGGLRGRLTINPMVET